MAQKEKLVSSRWMFVSGAIGLFTFAAYAYYSAGFSDIFSAIQKINLSLYAVAFLLVATHMMFNSLAWRSLLSTLGASVGIARTYTLTWVGFFVDATSARAIKRSKIQYIHIEFSGKIFQIIENVDK